jgi:hypothetical protein
MMVFLAVSSQKLFLIVSPDILPKRFSFSQKREQLPEDGQVRSKHVAVDCDFTVILN